MRGAAPLLHMEEFMEILNAIIQGIIQGLTEFLPISSSGHLALYQHFIGTGGENGTLLTVLLHLGTLLAVFIVYWKTILELLLEAFSMVGDVLHRRFSFKKLNNNRRMIIMLFISCIPLLILLIPVGKDLRLMDVLTGLSTDGNILAEGLAFLFTAFLLIYGSYVAAHRKRWHKVNTTDALTIGFAQMAAAGFAGVSRSGATISAGIISGVPKNYMVRYSFILGIPAILAANLMEIRGAVEVHQDVNILAAVLGIIAAAAVGVAAIKLLQWLVEKNMFQYFGYYCLALGAISTVIGIVEICTK